jgi:hypothetical protein
MVVSSGRIDKYLFHVSANKYVHGLIPTKFSIHPLRSIKFVQFALRLNVNVSS